MDRLPHTVIGDRLRFASGDWPAATQSDKEAREDDPILPDWALAADPTPPRPVQPIAATALGGDKILPGDHDGEGGTEHGNAVHHLLEILPGHRLDTWPARAGPDISRAALDEASAILTNPDFAHIFDPRTLAEVPITAPLEALGGRRLTGTIDRLIIGDGYALIVDFKTNAIVPDQPGDTPEGILRQMGAYAAALSLILPDHRIDLAILWTRTGTLMTLDHDIVSEALRRTPTS